MTEDTQTIAVQRARRGWPRLVGALATLACVVIAALLLISHTRRTNAPQPPASGSATSTAESASATSTEERVTPLAPDPVVFSDKPEPPPLTPVMLPVEAKAIYCFFRLKDADAARLKIRWSANGKDLGPAPPVEDLSSADGAVTGRITFTPPDSKGFAPGIYLVSFTNDAEPLLQSSFALAVDAAKILGTRPAPAAPVTVARLVTVAQLDEDDWPVLLSGQFRPTDRVTLLFDYLSGLRKAAFEVRWLTHGIVIPRATVQVPMASERGRATAWLQAQSPGLPPGTYKVQVLLAGGDEVLGETAFEVLEPGLTPRAVPGPTKPATVPAVSGPGNATGAKTTSPPPR